MDKPVTLSVYMDNNRPSISDLLNIYIAVFECIENGNDRNVIFHIDYIKYDYSLGKVYLPFTNSKKKFGRNICIPDELFNSLITVLRYSDNRSRELAENVLKIYKTNGSTECLNMLRDYRKKLNRSQRMFTGGSIIFVIVVFLIVIVYYRIYGISFY